MIDEQLDLQLLELKIARQRLAIAKEIARLIEFENTEFVAFEITNKSIKVALALKRELELWLKEKGIKDESN
jgi:hypothetical protein